MTRPRCLFVLSADFGEFVTANVLSRGQPIKRRFAFPPQLARYAGEEGGLQYSGAAELQQLIAAERPDAVVLCSGYLFAINGLFGPEALAELIGWLRSQAIAVATTDPWLRIWALQPQARFTIRSIRQGGVDADQTEKVQALQRVLEHILKDLPHLFAVPLPGGNSMWNSVFNPEFSGPAGPLSSEEEWLFILSREDFALHRAPTFFGALAARIDELLAVEKNRLKFVGPPALGRFLQDAFAGSTRVAFVPFGDFAAFEAAVRRAKIVAYWNVLSASLLYCLYHRVMPVFFGKGHQASVCEGLYEHIVTHVYRGRAPALLDLSRPLATHADGLIESLAIAPWLASLRADYARLPTLAQAIAAWPR